MSLVYGESRSYIDYRVRVPLHKSKMSALVLTCLSRLIYFACVCDPFLHVSPLQFHMRVSPLHILHACVPFLFHVCPLRILHVCVCPLHILHVCPLHILHVRVSPHILHACPLQIPRVCVSPHILHVCPHSTCVCPLIFCMCVPIPRVCVSPHILHVCPHSTCVCPP